MNRLETDGSLTARWKTSADEQTMTERYASGHPLTRPEIGVLLSYAKIVLFDELVASDLPERSLAWAACCLTIPAGMRKAYAEDIAKHRLRREIIATVLANHVINRGGPAFITTLSDATGQVRRRSSRPPSSYATDSVCRRSGAKSTRWIPSSPAIARTNSMR